MSGVLVAERAQNGAVIDFDIYHDARVNADVMGSYARVLADAPPVFWTPANGATISSAMSSPRRSMAGR